MVKFGRRLLALQYDPWKTHYLDYQKLKTILETGPDEKDVAAFRERDFVRQLNVEIEKIVLFFLEEQGQIAARLSNLRDEERECLLSARCGDEAIGSEAKTLAELDKLSNQFTQVGEDIVRLVHFVELNVTGMRKILKKHDKLYKNNKLSDRYLSEHYSETEDSHLRQLLHYEGVGALVKTLQDSITEMRLLKRILRDNITERGTMTSGAQEPYHRRMRTAPGPFYASHPEVSSSSPYWQPKTPQTATKMADSFTSHGSHHVDSSPLEDPILLRIEAARRRLHESSNFVQVLAAGELAMAMERISSEEDLVAMAKEELYIAPEVSRMSRFLNLMSTFLYMTNYYIVAPTSGKYASKLGGNAALAGIIIGMTPIAALVSTVLYSWWTSHSYKAALIFASACSVVGNVMYALGLPFENITLVMIGRLLNGFGSARAINRRYIADSFSREERTAASAAFVTAGALGMAAGPAIAALLDLLPFDSSWWSVENGPGWIMFSAWAVYLVSLVVWFRDPPKHDDAPKPPKDVEMTGERKALLSTVAEEDLETIPPPLWKNIPVMTTLFLYFVIKLALECCLSSTATLTDFYFDWGTQASGIYLAILGLLMFPANMLVAYYSRRFEDRELIMATLWMLLVGVWGIVNYGSSDSYTEMQFITFGVCIFLSSNALEGPNMSLLSKTIPRSYARGLFNVGLLATESGTFGRAIGDVFITLCGLNGIEYLLNNTFISLGVLVVVTLAGTYRTYPYLEPLDKDD